MCSTQRNSRCEGTQELNYRIIPVREKGQPGTSWDLKFEKEAAAR